MFPAAILTRWTILANINFTMNSLLSFSMNAALLVFMHILFKKITLPVFFKHFSLKVSIGIAVLGIIIWLRFILPDSDQQTKNLMLIVVWLLLLAVSFILLHYCFSQVDSAGDLIKNLLFFLVIPVAVLSIVTGGIIGIIVTVFEGIISAVYEITKARIEQRKQNIQIRKQNLEDGIYEGVTDEVRE